MEKKLYITPDTQFVEANAHHFFAVSLDITNPGTGGTATDGGSGEDGDGLSKGMFDCEW